jgi:hypothetical protein
MSKVTQSHFRPLRPAARSARAGHLGKERAPGDQQKDTVSAGFVPHSPPGRAPGKRPPREGVCGRSALWEVACIL